MVYGTFGRGVALLALLALASMGCANVSHHHPKNAAQAKRRGPPPHAPAHGYRHKHGDSELIFDTKLGVYIVLGHDHHYFDGSHYFRWVDGWQVSKNLRGSWTTISTGDVPPGLLKKKARGNGKARGHGKRKSVPAKHGY